MGNQYQPDLWVVVEIKQEGKDPWRRILGSWYGGYLNGDSWRLSSGITRVVEHDRYYQVHNESGSIYTCMKGAEGMSGLANGVLNTWTKKMDESKTGSIAVIDISTV